MRGAPSRQTKKLSNFLQVAAGGFHGAAVTHDGVVYTWGMGRQGALGHGDTATCFNPTRVTELSGVHIKQVRSSN